MKKIFALLLALAFVLPGCSAKSSLKEYDTGLGLLLYLPSGFEAFEDDRFPYATSNENHVSTDAAQIVVYVEYESNDTLHVLGYEYRDVKEYGDDSSSDDEIQTSAGMVGDRYVFDTVKDDIYYKIVCLPGNDGYYIVSMLCFSDSKQLPSRFDEFAAAIKVTDVASTPDYKTFDNGMFTIDLPDCMTEDDEYISYYSNCASIGFDHYTAEVFKENGFECPATEIEALEMVRSTDEGAEEIRSDGDLHYYIYRNAEEEISYVMTLLKASDGYLYCEGILYTDMEDLLLPAFVRWFKSIKVNF